MAQVMKQSIVLGGGRIVGEVSLDGGAVHGEGGPLRPQLIVPLTIAMQNQPSDAMLAVTSVRAWLCADQTAFIQNALCAPVTESLMEGFPARSLPKGALEHTVQLRFVLTAAEIEHLEKLRHKTGADIFTFYLGLEACVAGVKTFNEMTPVVAAEKSPWEMNLGLFSQVFPFWNSRISPTWVQIEQSTWVRAVLPGLGYDRARLIEMIFPPTLPEHPSAGAQFDKARKALDQRRYGDCIQECRGLLNMWEKQFGATAKQRIAEIVANDRGWPSGDIRRDLLDTLWKEVGDIANAPHHPEGNINAEVFDGRDARFLLLLTAALSENVERR